MNDKIFVVNITESLSSIQRMPEAKGGTKMYKVYHKVKRQLFRTENIIMFF